MKRSILFIICLMIISLQIKAQLNHKLSIGLLTSLDFYNIKYEETNKTYLQKYQAYRFGFKGQYNINEKWSLRSGLNYSCNNYKILKDIVFTFPQPIPFAQLHDSMNLKCWNIPISIGYTIYSNGNFKLTPSLAYVLSFLKGIKSTLTYYNYYKESTTDLKLTLHSVQFNLGIEYLINNRFLITLEPYVNINLSEIDKENNKANTFSFGEIISVNYKL